jgi:hypothetical protein
MGLAGRFEDSTDTGRIYIKGYLYPVLYKKNRQKGFYLSFFGAGYFEDINKT